MSRASKLFVLTLPLLLVGLYIPGVSAQQQVATGLTVSPGVIYTAVSKDEPTTQTVVTIRNNYSDAVNLTAELRGIDDASTKLLPADALPQDLSGVFNLSETLFTVPPLSDYRLTVQSKLIDGLGPGGHYASLLLSQSPGTGGGLSLNSAVSVTIFLTNKEGVKESLHLAHYHAPTSLFAISNKVMYTLENDGNVHTTPRGVVTIETTKGKVLAQGVLNSGSHVVFPGKTMAGETPLTQVATSWWPQRLVTKLQFRADNSSQITEVSSNHWYIPLRFIGLLALFAGLIWGLRHVVRRLRRVKKAKKHPATLPGIPETKELVVDDSEGIKIPVRVKKQVKKSPRKITINHQ